MKALEDRSYGMVGPMPVLPVKLARGDHRKSAAKI
jgi:hypothetical protein